MQPINAGDTAFVLISAALVALMTPGLAFFYGGLVRRKNFLAIMMQSFISMGIVTVIWVVRRLLARLLGRHRRRHREPRLGLPARRRRDARAVGADDPGAGPLRLPGDVRDHHARRSSRAPSPTASGSRAT